MAGSNGNGFNADERAKAREAGPITIGEQTYHPRRLTNARLRDIRRLAREAGRRAKVAAEESEEYKEAFEEVVEAGVGADGEPLKGADLRKYARSVALEVGSGSDAVAEINNESLQKQLNLLLVDDSMQPPPLEKIAAHLDEDLDTRDVEGLMTHLLGTDPTPETEPSPTT